MIDVTKLLPKGMSKKGAKLYKVKYDNRSKYILVDEGRNYRSFVYINNDFIVQDGRLKDLFTHYKYEMTLVPSDKKKPKEIKND